MEPWLELVDVRSARMPALSLVAEGATAGFGCNGEQGVPNWDQSAVQGGSPEVSPTAGQPPDLVPGLGRRTWLVQFVARGIEGSCTSIVMTGGGESENSRPFPRRPGHGASGGVDHRARTTHDPIRSISG